MAPAIHPWAWEKIHSWYIFFSPEFSHGMGKKEKIKGD